MRSNKQCVWNQNKKLTLDVKIGISLKSSDYYWPEAHPERKPGSLPGRAKDTSGWSFRKKIIKTTRKGTIHGPEEYYLHPWPGPEQKSLLEVALKGTTLAWIPESTLPGRFRARVWAGSNHYSSVRHENIASRNLKTWDTLKNFQGAKTPNNILNHIKGHPYQDTIFKRHFSNPWGRAPPLIIPPVFLTPICLRMLPEEPLPPVLKCSTFVLS